MENFADRLQRSIKRSNSFIVAGFDPRLHLIPGCILDDAASKTTTNDDTIYEALTSFYFLSLETLYSHIAAIKPNIAFFEQYGIPGLRAFEAICKRAKEHSIPVIADIKRGDIGSTAQAYSNAFLGKTEIFGKGTRIFDVDAITVNPFLGFDTIHTYFENCLALGKGLFVLVQTSNPGSKDFQSMKCSDTGLTISEKIADWLNQHAIDFRGSGGFSGLGAVVGATYPEEAQHLRKLMPHNFFLIPGMGAQGGTAEDSIAGFGENDGGAVINIARGLFSSFSSLDISKRQLIDELTSKAVAYKAQIEDALRVKERARKAA